jgi:myo-inositol-1-phosphate synthase/sugar/nucleoside kinase (ribokinase family)
MNKVPVWKGVYDPRFIGSSQHETATHVLTKEDAATDFDKLESLRSDIRYFIYENQVSGHTTMIWSASVEPNCQSITQLESVSDLLQAIEMTEVERGWPIPPSLLYATAALLEGCSFINGGSQNTLSCPALQNLAKETLGLYCLGTDYKAGQTKFKTAAVEYIRTMGLLPRVIASSNHLGNNDMKNLATSEATSTAKLRVKHDIFAPWEETDLDHKVSIMYTPFINDEKRDFVEYTSLGFLGQVHTMVTYTRASDSVLCVPLMIDGAVWCDFFSRSRQTLENVAKALAYLFKVPEGAAKGVDPGFFKQMQELNDQVMAAHETSYRSLAVNHRSKGHNCAVTEGDKWRVPNGACIVCAGLACVDMQLNNSSGCEGGESIESFEGETTIGGGSVSMAIKTLSRLCYGISSEATPVIDTIIPLCKVGLDSSGDKLIAMLDECGAVFQNVDTRAIRKERNTDKDARTALSVLPIYKDGRRGCFFDAASNATWSAPDLVSTLHRILSGIGDARPQAFLFGYPHLLPKMQGKELANVFLKARADLECGGITVMDLNGVPSNPALRKGSLLPVSELKIDGVIGSALEHVDIIHMNEEELELMTGCVLKETSQSDVKLERAANLFLDCGVAIILITQGRNGCFAMCGNRERFKRSPRLPQSWANCKANVGSVRLDENSILNTNGAGDSFTAGFLIAAMLRSDPTPENLSVAQTKSGKKSLASFMKANYDNRKVGSNDTEKRALFSKCRLSWVQQDGNFKSGKLIDSGVTDAGESFDLKSALKFASRIAAFHIDVSTRDDLRLFLHDLIEK